jgi:site-specific recombinase
MIYVAGYFWPRQWLRSGRIIDRNPEKKLADYSKRRSKVLHATSFLGSIFGTEGAFGPFYTFSTTPFGRAVAFFGRAP